MLKAQPRFSGNGGHGKRLVESEEEVFEKSSPTQAGRYGALALKAKNPKVQDRAFAGLERSLKAQRKPVAKGLFDTLAAKAPAGFLPNVGDKGLAGTKRSLGRSFKAGKSPDAAASGFKPKSTANQWAFKAGQSKFAPQIESAYARRKPLGYGATALTAGGTGYAVGKKYVPSKQLVAAGRQAELHAFKTAKPKPLVQAPKQKVYNLGVSKRARTYDSELNRQRRQGMYVAGGALGGGALVASGGRELARDMNAGKEVQGALARFGGRDIRLSREKGHIRLNNKGTLPVGLKNAQRHQRSHKAFEHLGPVTHAEREAMARLPHLGQRTSRATKGKLGAGAALLAGSGGMYKHSRSKANRRWN